MLYSDFCGIIYVLIFKRINVLNVVGIKENVNSDVVVLLFGG